MALIDIGVNLTHESFAHDGATVVARAQAAGVAQFIITGASLAGSGAALQLARQRPQVTYATAGVHPHHASELQVTDQYALQALLAAPEVVAVGECGLDYFRNLAPRESQLQAFAWQLQWGAASGKPLFLHQRDAHADFLAVLREHRACFTAGVAHCFTGGVQELQDYLELGLAIGITGWICDKRRGLQLRELVREIPAGRLVLETDAPYLLPRDLHPLPATRRNEPAHLVHIAATVARLRGESLASCVAHTSAAARALFRLDATPPP